MVACGNERNAVGDQVGREQGRVDRSVGTVVGKVNPVTLLDGHNGLHHG